MKLLTLAAALLMTACAIPVRPIARLVPDADGVTHFVPDTAQEPHVSPAVVSGIAGVLGAMGPMGQLAALAVSVLTAGAVGHAHGSKKKKLKTADLPKVA